MNYDRLYYTIGQVSKISGLPQSVLRYWETVFKSLNPPKSDGGTRQYTDKDIEIVFEIKKLLYDEGFTIKGANKHIMAKYVDSSESNEDEISRLEDKNDYNHNKENGISDFNLNSFKLLKDRIQSIINMLDE